MDRRAAIIVTAELELDVHRSPQKLKTANESTPRFQLENEPLNDFSRIGGYRDVKKEWVGSVSTSLRLIN
jgi:hypothetical protein